MALFQQLYLMEEIVAAKKKGRPSIDAFEGHGTKVIANFPKIMDYQTARCIDKIW